MKITMCEGRSVVGGLVKQEKVAGGVVCTI